MSVETVTQVPRLSRRDRDAHKGDFGRVLIVGGSRGMIGAPALAGNAAFRGGAGLVTIAVPASIQLSAATLCPCATSIPLEDNVNVGDDMESSLKSGSVGQVLLAASASDVVAIGPGFGVGQVQRQIVEECIAGENIMVVDADGLNNLSAIVDWDSKANCPMILTPHPGEFARLVDRPIDEIQSSRVESALAAVNKWNEDRMGRVPIVLVLKGNGTIVTDGQSLYVNTTGNPGMACGGSGDVLTGLIAALLAQGLPAFDAAVLGVWCHGRAGDLAAEKFSEVSMIASDIIDLLPAAIKEVLQ